METTNLIHLSWQTEIFILIRLLIAFLLGALIGWERESHGRQAGIRTFGAISLGACVFGIISLHAPAAGADPSRIAAQIVSGVGFLGAGVIFREGKNIGGLTTAATLWATAAVGLGVAFGMYAMSITAAFLIFLLLYLPRMRWWHKLSRKNITAD